jgi:beta-glucosidase/6-phospho-beta-glucosidase/beta-galactosidase
VQQWIILNEPKTFTGMGYWQGRHAPGRTDPLQFLRATHTVNLAQGQAFAAMKASNARLLLGSAFDVAPMFPLTQSYADMAAAERWHKFQNLWFVETALHGRYPEGVLPVDQRDALLGIRSGDSELMRAPLDFIGLNYYSPSMHQRETAFPAWRLAVNGRQCWDHIPRRIWAGMSIRRAFTTSWCAWRMRPAICPSRSRKTVLHTTRSLTLPARCPTLHASSTCAVT